LANNIDLEKRKAIQAVRHICRFVPWSRH